MSTDMSKLEKTDGMFPLTCLSRRRKDKHGSFHAAMFQRDPCVAEISKEVG